MFIRLRPNHKTGRIIAVTMGIAGGRLEDELAFGADRRLPGIEPHLQPTGLWLYR